MKTWDEARADVVGLGIWQGNLRVDRGDPEDFGMKAPIDEMVDGRIVEHGLSSEEENAYYEADMRLMCGDWETGRRWAYVETSAGLAEDEHGKSVHYPQARELEKKGWEYMGSGGYRVEIETATVPPVPDPA